MNVSQTLPAPAPARASAPAPHPARRDSGAPGAARDFDAMVAGYAGTAEEDQAAAPEARGRSSASPTGESSPSDDAASLDWPPTEPATAVPPFAQPAELAGWAIAFRWMEAGNHATEADGDVPSDASAAPVAADKDADTTAPADASVAPDVVVPVPLAPDAPNASPDGSEASAVPTSREHREMADVGESDQRSGRPVFTGGTPGLDRAAARTNAQATEHAIGMNPDVATGPSPLPDATAGAAPIAEASAPAIEAKPSTDHADAATAIPSTAPSDGRRSAAARASSTRQDAPVDTRDPASAVHRSAPEAGSSPAVIQTEPRSARHVAAGPVLTYASSASAVQASPSSAPASAASTALNDALPDTTIRDLVQSVRLRALEGGGEARIRLEPHHFGEVTVSLRVDEGQVVARVVAESSSVRDWLQANQQWLRTQLAEQQLTLDRLEVREPSEAQEPRQGDSGQQPREQRPRQRRAPGRSDARFEVIA